MGQTYQTDQQRIRILRRRVGWLKTAGKGPELSKNARAKNAMELEALTFVLNQWERLQHQAELLGRENGGKIRRVVIEEDAKSRPVPRFGHE